MTDSNQLTAPNGEGRFEHFTDGERFILSDGLRELLKVKMEALEIANAGTSRL